MGVISDAIDSLQEWCENLFKDGIKSQFDSISDLMTETFHKTTEDGGLISTFLTGHPASFSGSASGGTTIWSTIETLCNNVVVPIGGFILVIILLNDLIQTVIRGNNFKDFDDSIFIKWIIKALCGVILVSNVFYIASALFSFGTDACANGITTLFGTGDFLSTDLALKKSALNSLGLGELITVWFISLIVHLGVMIMMVAIVIVLASRIIEVFMYLGVAPIPMAAMLDSGEWSGIGKNWIKQLLALSFQGFFIIIALGIFKTLLVDEIQHNKAAMENSDDETGNAGHDYYADENYDTDGNATLIKHEKIIYDSEEMQFIAVTTKDGDVFYILINYSAEGDEDNVFFLNKVDDFDLYSLLYAGNEEEEEKDPAEQAKKYADAATNIIAFSAHHQCKWRTKSFLSSLNQMLVYIVIIVVKTNLLITAKSRIYNVNIVEDLLVIRLYTIGQHDFSSEQRCFINTAQAFQQFKQLF